MGFEATKFAQVPFSHPVQICYSNHTHFLMSFNSHASWPMVTPTDQEKCFTARNENPMWPEEFSKPICAMEERNGPPSQPMCFYS